MHVIGLDLAWRTDHPSGAVALDARRLRLRLGNSRLAFGGHHAVLVWLVTHALVSTYGLDSFRPGRVPGRDRPATREV
jgi:predicted RNase H-like nuclease